ncbi:MAG: hypothetical protein HY907_21975 [Deltaproteobacteria bacterium]|nr:hypothetical protein [Deltaproteobacteria bacterium]
MEGTRREIGYWEKAGGENTGATLELAAARARELGLAHVVVASNTGATARAALAAFERSVRVVCVTHSVGFRKPGEDEMGDPVRRELAAGGAAVLTTTHFFAGVDRALRFLQNGQGGYHPAEVAAMTLRILGQGLKVAVEIATMAADAGLVPVGREVMAIGGTGRGADTAVVLRAAHGQSFFGTRVVEIVCMPRGGE